MTAASPRPALSNDEIVRRSKVWIQRLKAHPIVCPHGGSSVYKANLLEEAHRAFSRELAEMCAGDVLDYLPRWRELGAVLAKLDADVRHARECESGWPANDDGGGA